MIAKKKKKEAEKSSNPDFVSSLLNFGFFFFPRRGLVPRTSKNSERKGEGEKKKLS